DGHDDLARARGDTGPVAVLEPQLLPDTRGDIERVFPVDLPQPGILRAPGVIHRHRPLGECMEGEAVVRFLTEWRIPYRQRIHRLFQPSPQVFGRLAVAMPLGGPPEPLQGLAPEREEVWQRFVEESKAYRPILIGDVPGFEEARLLRHGRDAESAVRDIAVQLVGVRGAASRPASVAAPAH